MSRRRFTERQVIEALIRTGHEIRCYRSKQLITLDSVKRLEREHVTPLALGGADDPTNAAYSLSEEHKLQTNGRKHNRTGSDRHAIGKAGRLETRANAHVPGFGFKPVEPDSDRCGKCGEYQGVCQCLVRIRRKAKIANRPFQKQENPWRKNRDGNTKKLEQL